MDDAEKRSAVDALYARVQADPGYRTASMGEVFVPGTGSLAGHPIVFIGEAPGRDEEKKRQPFVGPAGRNLTELLVSIGLPRDQVYITNLVKYRPTTPSGDNRSPTAAESRAALPYLLEELSIASPRIVVCLGLSAAKALLGNPALRMSQANGALFEAHGLRILVTYHPSPYNYKIEEKRAAMFEAFKRLGALLSSTGT